jgi:hypothetical protein
VPGDRKNGLQTQNEERQPQPNRPKRRKIPSPEKNKTGMNGFSAACEVVPFYKTGVFPQPVKPTFILQRLRHD